MLEFIPAASPLSIAVSIVMVALAVFLYTRRKHNSLPGPTGVPFLGYLPYLQDDYHLQLDKLGKKYGDVFSFTVTGQPYVVINSQKIMREAFVSKADSFDAKPTKFSLLKYGFEKGFFFKAGDEWKVLRKFYVQNLKEFGLNSLKKGNLVAPLDNALHVVIEEFRKSKGQPFDAVPLLTRHCTAIVQQLLFRGVDIADQDMDDLLKAYADMLLSMQGTNLLLSGPIAQYFILPYRSGFRGLRAGRKTMMAILLKIIRNHETSLDFENPRDLVDSYIIERNFRTRKEDSTARYFTNEGLASSLIQLLGDASISTGYFVALFLQTIAKRPDVQLRMRDELSEVVGADRVPSLDDKSNLPYCNAVIIEILRSSSFLNIFPSVMCSKDTTLGGYKVPAGHITLVNFYSILHNSDVYKNPETFDPMRFIATPDKPKEESPLAFGVGRRACAGEALAMSEVFLFAVTLVRHFRLTLPSKQDGDASTVLTDLNLPICALPLSEA